MGVYIRGMDEMPEDNDILVVRNGDDCNPYIKCLGTLGYSMELVEVKTPHGDLIDKNELESRINLVIAILKKLADGFGLGNEETQDLIETYEAFIEAVKISPVVIEAEGDS